MKIKKPKTPFQLQNTHGLPLAATIVEMKKLGLVVDMPHYVREALEAGWTHDKIKGSIFEAISMNGGMEEWHSKYSLLTDIMIDNEQGEIDSVRLAEQWEKESGGKWKRAPEVEVRGMGIGDYKVPVDKGSVTDS